MFYMYICIIFMFYICILFPFELQTKKHDLRSGQKEGAQRSNQLSRSLTGSKVWRPSVKKEGAGGQAKNAKAAKEDTGNGRNGIEMHRILPRDA